MDSREHRRVRLSLPVRLRWSTPFGQKNELCESVNVSRDGLLVACKQPHSAGVRLWITFPYDASLPDGQPEVPARVLRCTNALDAVRGVVAPKEVRMPCGEDVAEALTVAVRFEAPLHIVANGNGHSGKDERRASPRRPLALPIQVRPERMPWFEEAMTVDVSLEGVRFLSTREYEPGHQLLVSFDPSSTPPWHGARVFRSRVVRVEPVPESSTLAVTVCRLS